MLGCLRKPRSTELHVIEGDGVTLSIGKHNGFLSIHLDEVIFVHFLHHSSHISWKLRIVDLRCFLELELFQSEPLFNANDVIRFDIMFRRDVFGSSFNLGRGCHLITDHE